MGTEAARHAHSDAGARGSNLPLAVVLTAVWIAFTTFTAVVLFDFGIIGFMEAAVANGATTQVSLDLILSIVIALSFIRGDARRMGLPYWPYVAATVLTGSIGLLAYVIHRTVADRPGKGVEPSL